jgi:hydroxymethylbilane synthase
MIPYVIGTRGSELATAQTRQVMADLKKAWPTRNFELRIIKTQGDALVDDPARANEALGKGIFTSELEAALLGKRIDMAVHSLKDLPTTDTPGLMLAATPKRADARDVLISRKIKEIAKLPKDGTIATGSPRRQAQLLKLRPDLKIVGIRGNIDTRLQKFRQNFNLDGTILAAAGLERLQPKILGFTVAPIPLTEMLPAPGQGALALQTRIEGSEDLRSLLESIHDPLTATAVIAERAFLSALGGGCREPIAAYAEVVGAEGLKLSGIAWLRGAATPKIGEMTGTIYEPEALGQALAAKIVS